MDGVLWGRTQSKKVVFPVMDKPVAASALLLQGKILRQSHGWANTNF